MRRRDPPGPVALDPASGFKVPYRDLVKQWDGEWVDRRFVDKRNPQDLIRARADNPTLDHPQPEPTDVFLTTEIQWEDDSGPIAFEGVGTMILEDSIEPELP